MGAPQPPVEIRVAGIDDAERLARVHLDTVLEAYRPIFPPDAPQPTLADMVADWTMALARPDTTVLAAVAAGGVVVGTVKVGPHPDLAGEGELSRLHVLPGWWDGGIGGRLHDAAVELLEQAGWIHASLWVLEANQRARGFYQSRGWRLVTGPVLRWPSGVTEVRYRRRLVAVHPERDAVAAEVRGWYIHSTPAIGLEMTAGRTGFFITPGTYLGARMVLTVDDPADVPDALAEMDEHYGDQPVDVWIDDRDRAARLAPALAAAGCEQGTATVYLALVGDVETGEGGDPAAGAGPDGLTVHQVGVSGPDDPGPDDPGADDPALVSWCRVKLQGFGDTEDEPTPAQLQAEVAGRRSEQAIACCLLGVLDGEPVAALSYYTGEDQMVFNLATRVPFRHQGIARAMLARWAEAGRAAGCRALLINADDGGRPAALYNRLGFVDEVYWQQRWRRPAPSAGA